MYKNKKGTKLETCVMLTLSTAHIKEVTTEYLNDSNRSELSIYPKLDFGWFIYLTSECLEEEMESLPDDLQQVIKFAIKNGADVLCLDCDGPIMEQLPFYVW